MKSKTSSLSRKLYPAYRVLWRGWIFILIMGVVEEASLFAHNGHGLLTFALLAITWVPIRIFAEYNHPKPQNLGVSDVPLTWAWFATFSLTVALNWYYQFHDQINTGLPWLYVALGAVAVAYFVRPHSNRRRPVSRHDHLTSVIWLAASITFMLIVGFGAIHFLNHTPSR